MKRAQEYTSRIQVKQAKSKKGGYKEILPPSPNAQPLYEINQIRISPAYIHHHLHREIV